MAEFGSMTLQQKLQTAIRRSELGFTLHALQRLTARRIAVHEVKEALLGDNAEVIEDYPEDPRGPSCLVLATGKGRRLHIHVSYPPDVVVITAYGPDVERWMPDWRHRR